MLETSDRPGTEMEMEMQLGELEPDTRTVLAWSRVPEIAILYILAG